jgi:energy-coupling factor transporter ATP-binding protein EcfA2
MITNITHTLRGQNASHDLGKITIITGPAGSGKSSILDAITLALCGFIPRLGKTCAKLESVISGTEASAEIKFAGSGTSPNPSALFTIKRNSDGSLSKRGGLFKDAFFDAEAFSAATRKERAEMIISSRASEESKIIAKIAAAARITAPKKAVLGEWIEQTRDSFREQVSGLRQALERVNATRLQMAGEIGEKPDFDSTSHLRLMQEIGETKGVLQGLRERLRLLGDEPAIPDPYEGNVPTEQDVAEILKNGKEAARKHEALLELAKGEVKECPHCGSPRKHWKRGGNDSKGEPPSEEEIRASEVVLLAERKKYAESEGIRRYVACCNDAIAAHKKWLDESSALASSINDHERRLGALSAAAADMEIAAAEASAYAAKAAVVESQNKQAEEFEGEMKKTQSSASEFAIAVQHAANEIMLPIIDAVNAITQPILNKLVINNAFDIGLECDGEWVPFDGLISAAIQCATIAGKRDARILMIDEANRLGGRLIPLIEAMAKKIDEGGLDQLILAGVDLNIKATKDIKVIKLK